MKHFATQMNDRFVVLCNHTINDENHFTTDRMEVDCQNCGYLLREDNLLWLMEILTESSIGMSAFRPKKPQEPTKAKKKKARSKAQKAADSKMAARARAGKAEKKGKKKQGVTGNKLTAEIVREMKKVFRDSDATNAAVAEMFGISPAMVYGIKRGQYWKEVVIDGWTASVAKGRRIPQKKVISPSDVPPPKSAGAIKAPMHEGMPPEVRTEVSDEGSQSQL